jgi:hypothetical protein
MITYSLNKNRTQPLLMGFLVLFVFVGCQSIKTDKKFPWEKSTAPVITDHIAAVWTEAVHNQTGKASQRGFGGRLIFYDAEQQPLKVEGQVTIFVFDDERESIEDPSAKYKFVFPANVLDKHYSKSPLGHSYSFWLPLAPADSPTHKYSMVARLDGVHGETVLSSLTRKVLSGRGPAAATAIKTSTSDNSNSVRKASYAEAITNDQDSRSLKSETIEITPSFSERLRSSPREPTKPEPIEQQSDRNVGDVTESLPAVDSQPAKSPAPSESLTPPTARSPRREPRHGEWLSGLPPTPRSGFRSERTTQLQSHTALSQRAQQWFQAQAQKQSATEAPTENSLIASSSDD